MSHNDDICAICHEPFIINDKSSYTPCLHKYHAECLTMWIEKYNNTTCPLCNSFVSARNTNSPIILTPADEENERTDCCLVGYCKSVNKYVMITAISFGIIAVTVIVVLALI